MKAHKNEGTMKPQYETRLALLEQSNTHFAETLKRIDNNIITLHQHITDLGISLNAKMDAKFDQIEKKIVALNDKVDGNFKYIITTMLTLFVASGLLPVLSSLLQKFIH